MLRKEKKQLENDAQLQRAKDKIGRQGTYNRKRKYSITIELLLP
jgi:hypothetical protein